MGSNAFTTNEMMMTHNNRKFDKTFEAMASNTTMPNKSKKPHTGLLRRRHSLPEIIMRRHQLASQKHVFSDMNASSAPSPPARERVPQSFESRERTRTASPISSLGSSASTIVPNGFASAGSTGSDSNLNRIFPTNGSMRQQLLRRLWHKEYRRLDRTGSLSPPLHRSLRTKRTLRMQDTSPEVCSECERLEVTHFNRSVPEFTMKHIKHTNSLSHPRTSSSASSLSFARKSYIETETQNERSPLTISSVSSERKSSPPAQSDITTTNTNTELDVSITANLLNQMNGNIVNEDHINGNSSSQANGENSFLIEMEGDQINITTMAAAESTAISETTLQVSSDESSLRHHEQLSESTISQISSGQWYDGQHNDSNNNYNSNGENDSKSKITEISHMKSGTYEAYHMSSGEIDIENESVVRLKTIKSHEPLDQSAIDTIISQILVDSLNNIIVVQGKGNQIDSNGDNIVELNTSQTQTENAVMANESFSHVSNSSPLPLPVTDQVFFPHYMSSETLSEYSTKLSDNSNEFLSSNLVISVISGSSYPGNGGEIVVHRMTDMSRTESMEVQPSSAPPVHADDENGNPIAQQPIKTATTTEDDDDVTSLVDSLDDPNAIENVREFEITPNDLKIVEKSQAFFVPIENSDVSSENFPTPTDLNAPIAETMPERLRERLHKRQMEIVERKEAESRRRQEKIQKLIGQHGKNKSSSDSKTNTPSFEVIPDESPKTLKKPMKVVSKKGNSKQLQTEIGSLESYTVDGQGNLKFVEAGKKSNGGKKVTTISGPVVKHVTVKKTITTNQPLAIGKKQRENAASDKSSAEKRIKVTSNTTKYRGKEIVSHKTPKDVQKMLLGQHSPSDIITPDRDCGPRRMYQKTEIQEGAKRIEILEIVECLNSSPDSINPSQSSSSSPPTDSTLSQSLVERFSTKHTSKIPVPVLAKNKSRVQLNGGGNQQRTLKAQIRDSVSHYNGTALNNSKVDQIIADLLIEALNNSTDIGIEFIKTPQNATAQSHTKANPAKRMSLSTRRSNSGGNGSGKRSAHSSGKYQHVFDSIPEEKSGSLSIESPTDENTNSTANPASETEIKTTTNTIPSHANKSIETRQKSPTKCMPNGSQKSKIASGKAAIESDQIKSETWFGCFGRTHVDSEHPVDGLLMEEVVTEEKSAPKTVSENSTNAQTEPNTLVSTAISSVATKDSALTSIPSEAPVRELESVGSDSILPLIEETFESSVTGNRGGDAANGKPFRKNARCSAQNHFDAPCSECESIENNLKEQANSIKKKTLDANPTANDEKLHLVALKPSCHSTSNENVWQVAHLEKYDTMGKFMLNPITVCSAQGTSTLTNNSSFIVLHDENENSSHFLPNITSGETDPTPVRNGQNIFDRADCCFCNPSLHHKRRNGSENSPKKCNFCSSRQQSTQTTPATSTRNQEKGQSINNNTDTSRPLVPVERIYESKYRSNHTHIRTHSKESDTINTQCTKKTNRKVRKSVLSGSDDRLNGNSELNRNKTEDRNGNEVNGNKPSKQPKSSIPKLPPATTEWITHSTDSTTSPSSSNSTGSNTKSHCSYRRQDSKSVPNLPRTERWQNATDSSPSVKPQKSRTNSRYQNFYGNGTGSATERRASTPAVTSNETKSKSKPTGWTVTVAGTYSDDMAPDVQMHLSFPKRAANQRKTIEKSTSIPMESTNNNTTELEIDTNSNYNDIDLQTPDAKPAILPPPTPQSIKLNPKRSLTKNYLNLMQHQQQHSQLVPHRKFSFDSNGNANLYQRTSAKDYCNHLPHINNDHDQANRIIAKQTAKKTIKRSEYSVSVASATTTTRTISNFANGKRAMSIQALNANSFQRFNNGSRRGLYGRRDHSADPGQLTYRLSASPSPLPSSAFYSPTTIGYDDETDRNGNINSRTNLSVCGNAIAPERKPPVPTNTERDVTRRHDACFTRTRSIFL
ncbi:probable serine/threonine-protein kinase DDB_G0282963 isoform X2 [Contarinia nasturtii]|nr:probable serine/threonine-protein kinase DDB_G0282963 isoform X2 [Contarinia nasturtii]